MKFHEWLRTRTFLSLADAEKDPKTCFWIDNLDEEYTLGIYVYGDTGFLEENTAACTEKCGTRYTCTFYCESFESNDLHEVEVWLYKNIVEEGNFEADPMLDPQLG